MRHPVRRSLVILSLLASVLPACSDKPVKSSQSDVNTVTPIESTAFAPALGVDLAASTKAPSGLYYRDMTVGTGATVASGQKLSMRYTGWLANGTRFDQGTYSFHLGGHEVIDGWDLGAVGMKVGGRRQLIIPPALGYGAPGSPPVIPPNAVLVFIVDLLGAQ